MANNNADAPQDATAATMEPAIDATTAPPDLELLTRRLARLEARVYGTAGATNSRPNPTTTAHNTQHLRARLQRAAARVAAAGERVGEVGARQQLEREMLLAPSSSASSALPLLAPPPLSAGSVEAKAAWLVAQEGELTGVLEGLRAVERLRGPCVDEPWPVLGGGCLWVCGCVGVWMGHCGGLFGWAPFCLKPLTTTTNKLHPLMQLPNAHNRNSDRW